MSYFEFDEFGNLFSVLFFLLLELLKFGFLEQIAFFGKGWDFCVDLYDIGIEDVFTFKLLLFLLFTLFVVL